VTVALAHLSFNVLGIAIYYPLKGIPIWLATRAGRIASRSRKNSATVIILYVALIFLPLLYVFLT
jgi:sodium-dependent phosphate cotransporter